MKRHLFAPFSRRLNPLVAALSGTLLATAAVAGGEDSISTHIIKVSPGGADVIEADVSDLQLGESLDFVTESGQVIDILNVPEGFEIYIDGELVDPQGLHGDLELLHKHIAIREERLEVECEGDTAEDCETRFEAIVSGDFDHGEVIIARHEISEFCDENGDCDTSVWISSDDDLPVHIQSDGGEGQVIIIEKKLEGDLY